MRIASFGAFALLIQIVSASPYVDSVFSIHIGDYRWGIWRYVDAPVDPHAPMIAPNADYKSQFATYWYFSLGRYLEIRISQGALIALVICIALLAAWLVRKRILRRKQAGDG